MKFVDRLIPISKSADCIHRNSPFHSRGLFHLRQLFHIPFFKSDF